ncbi:MAG: ribonuclease HII, partial [Gemmatimonadaceae bacterium]
MRVSRIERELRDRFGPNVAGVDEVGRGPLAGPVVACAVVMPVGKRAIPGVEDSKVLPERARDELAVRIREAAVALGVGAASVREIDTYNIYQATSLAIRRAVRRLGCAPDHVLLDGRPIKSLGMEHTAVVDGDAFCYAIACASIVAKVTRDRLMRALAARYPRYAWDRNVGYATAEH